MGQKRPASQRMEHFGQGGMHAFAHACRQNHNVHGVGIDEFERDYSMRPSGQGDGKPGAACVEQLRIHVNIVELND